MKKYQYIIITVLAVVLAVFILGRFRLEGLTEGRRAPEFALTDLQGNEVNLLDFRGQVVMLNFWSAACGPCREKMPSVQQVYDEFKSGGFAVLAINVNDHFGMASSFIEKNGYTFTVLMDDGAVSSLYDVQFIPKTFILDQSGIIRFVTVGPAGAEKLRSVVEQLL